jgi:hypothetical protein
VLTIIAFGTLTLALHRELLRGDRAALRAHLLYRDLLDYADSGDAIYFSHSDWPKGTSTFEN